MYYKQTQFFMVIIEKIDWDDWNTHHIEERHGVTRADVEEVIGNDPLYLEAYKTRKGRVALVGSTNVGRFLTIILGPNPDDETLYYVFTAFPASRQTRRYYHEQKQKGGVAF